MTRPSYYDLIAALRILRNKALQASVTGKPIDPEAIADATAVIQQAQAEPPTVDAEESFDALLIDIGVTPRRLTRNERLQLMADAGCDTREEYEGLR